MTKGISEQDVHEAADALLAEGLRPTIERLRQRLGRGSPNTVNRYIDTWWKGLADRVRGKRKGDMPVEVVRLAGRLWAAALAQARQELGSQPDLVPGTLKAIESQLGDLNLLLGRAGRIRNGRPRKPPRDSRRSSPGRRGRGIAR